MNHDTRSNFFKARDNNQRCSKVKFILKSKLRTLLNRRKEGMSLSKMAVKEKVSYYRLKKAFNEIDPIESIVTEDDYNKNL